MMKKYCILLTLLTAITFGCYSQELNKKTIIDYSNITEMSCSVNPSYFAFEITTVNGISINKNHLIGLGVGYGGNDQFVCPIFANYRYRFTPYKNFCPHVNLAVGTMLSAYNNGLYSTLTGGFTAGVFSLSAGIFFYSYKIGDGSNVLYEDLWNMRYVYMTPKTIFPFGINFRIGVNF